MICPNDNAVMHEVKIESHYGIPIVIDQCSECGGIWFDRSELFMARSGEAEKVDFINPGLFVTLTMVKVPKLVCPRDGADLIRFTDRFFPDDIMLVRCPVCGGMWLNRGEFVRFQAVRRELQHARGSRVRDKKFEDEIKQILATDRSSDTIAALDNLGKFLNTPVEDTNPFATDSAREQSGAQRAMDIIMNILSLVLGVVTRGRLF